MNKIKGKKIKWEKPLFKNMGNIMEASLGACTFGSSVINDCGTGGLATAQCVTGNAATTHCDVGATIFL